VATECSRNDRSKTQYYVVILDRLQGRSRALEQAPESQIRGPLTIGTILDSLITFRILFPLVKEVNPPPSRHYISQPSPSTIISGSGNASPKGLCTPLRNVLYIQSALSLSLICQSLILVLMLMPRSLLISIPLGNTLCLQTSLTLTPDCHRLSPILVS